MNTEVEIEKELNGLISEFEALFNLSTNIKKIIEFGTEYQPWYTRSLKLVELLGPDRLAEFISYYQIDHKRKYFNAATYTIQDYINGIGARKDGMDQPLWDISNVVAIRLINQTQIIKSLRSRLSGVLADVRGHLLAQLEDEELRIAGRLVSINLRAAGALAGVVLEAHLQRVAVNHKVAVTKKSPTISDLNDPLKAASVYDVPTWRKIQHLADIRNLCDHKKEREPTKVEVDDLLSGVNAIVKTVF